MSKYQEFVNHLREQRAVIERAWPSLLLILLPVTGAIWWAMDWRYNGIIANKDVVITSKNELLNDFREKLKSPTPDDAKRKLDTAQKAIADLTALTNNPAANKPVAETVKDEIVENKDGTFWVRKLVNIKAAYVPPVFIIEIFSKGEIVEWNVQPIDLNAIPIWFDVDKPTIKSAAISAPNGRYLISVRVKENPSIRFNLRFN